MFDIGLQELILIFVIALLVFGPKNLPQLGRSLGRAMREFKKASAEFESTIRTNLQIDEIDQPPAPPPDSARLGPRPPCSRGSRGHGSPAGRSLRGPAGGPTLPHAGLRLGETYQRAGTSLFQASVRGEGGLAAGLSGL